MSEMEWSSNAVRVLMAQYERRPELWDRRHDLYRTTTAKYKAWLAIAKIFSCNVTELRKKFNSLMASYRRERSKVKEGGRSTWFLYPHMAFLPGYLRNPPPPPLLAVLDTKTEPDAEESAEEEEEEALGRYETESEREAEARADPLQPPPPPPPPPPLALYKDHRAGCSRRRLARRPSRERGGGEARRAEVETRLRRVEAAVRGAARRDDCGSYGEYIAATLRKHDHKTRSLIKQAINNILFEQEMNQCGGEEGLTEVPEEEGLEEEDE